jgi:hypothetical protein
LLLNAVGLTQFGSDWTQVDILGDGYPQDAEMALVEFVLCHDTYRYHQMVHDVLYGADGVSGNKGLLTADIAILAAVDPNFGALTSVSDLLAAMIAISPAMRDTINGLILQLTGGATGLPSYASYQLFAWWGNDIFAADGDLDGDTLTNKTEYDQVMAVGGSLDLFVKAATDPFNFWPNNPALPACGIAALIVLFGAAAGRALTRKK